MKQIYNILLICMVSVSFFACQGDELGTRESVGYLRVAFGAKYGGEHEG